MKPIAQKTSDYQYADLSKKDPDWIRLHQNQSDGDPGSKIPGETEASASDENLEEGVDVFDVSFQSKKTASTIALTTSCRPRYSIKNEGQIFPELKDYMQQLLLGITAVTERLDEETEVAGIPALQTTVVGKMQDQPIKIRAVVLKKRACLYDLVYITKPRHFSDQEKFFLIFRDSIVIP
ncbi:MAG: hypothetical protein JNL01_14830 [Bdellovibrionales bacterium]|nr:hypothetical protein [Bdellovibrionales bacterium]